MGLRVSVGRALNAPAAVAANGAERVQSLPYEPFAVLGVGEDLRHRDTPLPATARRNVLPVSAGECAYPNPGYKTLGCGTTPLPVQFD